MKRSLSHLPDGKRHELNRIRDVILEAQSGVEMIILFGSHGRGDWVYDRHFEGHVMHTYRSDYDVLVVTGEPTRNNVGIEQRIEHALECHAPMQTGIGIIVHDIEYLNRRLGEGHYFFSDLKKEGVWLYNSKRFKLARRRELDTQERRKLAKEHYDVWYPSAQAFFKGFRFYCREKEYKIAAFELHQATERAWKAALLVYCGYAPRTHDIRVFERRVCAYETEFLKIFDHADPESERKFTLLQKAYKDARYDPEYTITRDELKYLGERVKLLLELVEPKCKDVIGA